MSPSWRFWVRLFQAHSQQSPWPLENVFWLLRYLDEIPWSLNTILWSIRSLILEHWMEQKSSPWSDIRWLRGSWSISPTATHQLFASIKGNETMEEGTKSRVWKNWIFEMVLCCAVWLSHRSGNNWPPRESWVCEVSRTTILFPPFLTKNVLPELSLAV